MKAFKKSLDRLIRSAKTQRDKVDANNVLVQLQRYRGAVKKNAKLSYFATGILAGINAMDVYLRLQKAQDRFDIAEKFGNDLQKLDAQVDLETARTDYREALRAVPKGLRPLHPKP